MASKPEDFLRAMTLISWWENYTYQNELDARHAIAQVLGDLAGLRAENVKLRDVQRLVVTMPDGGVVAAPCAIEGCHYDRVEAAEAEIARLQRVIDATIKVLTRLQAEIGRLPQGGYSTTMNTAERMLSHAIQELQDVSAAPRPSPEKP